ncbi:MAG: class I SAM-dependent methyltransferase [Planctomycetaceae bacterium]|nr:class I SAM-dependent methyltransferase [Planctomycetaceae bacterium]
MKVTSAARMQLSTDFEIRMDFDRNLFGWREDRAGRTWINRNLIPLTTEKVQALLRFKEGASPAEIADELAESGAMSNDEALAWFEELENLGVLAPAGAVPGRPDERFLPFDFEPGFAQIRPQVKEATLTSVEKQYALYNAVDYLTRAKIPGDIAECGVWRGGSSMICALTLLKDGDTSRHLHLFDTYEGMPDSTEKDVFLDGKSTIPKGALCAGIDIVQENMFRTGYPREKMHFIKGMVEETLPQAAPERLALLRLDTDFHDSTYHALVHLYPRLVPGGVLVLDDFGSMQGARDAVLNYLRENNFNILIHRIERLGIAIKS